MLRKNKQSDKQTASNVLPNARQILTLATAAPKRVVIIHSDLNSMAATYMPHTVPYEITNKHELV